jgi:hypothetical protein
MSAMRGRKEIQECIAKFDGGFLRRSWGGKSLPAAFHTAHIRIGVEGSEIEGGVLLSQICIFALATSTEF